MTPTQVQFYVTYEPALIQAISEVAAKMDLGLIGFSSPEKVIYSWDTTSIVDEKYIKAAEDVLRKSFEQLNHKLLSIDCLNSL